MKALGIAVIDRLVSYVSWLHAEINLNILKILMWLNIKYLHVDN